MASSRRSTLGAIGLLAVCVALGVAAAVVGAFVHTWTVAVGGVALVVGLPIALAVLAVVVFVVAPRLHPAGAWAAASAWLVVATVFSWPRGAGDIVIPGTWDGYTFLFLGIVIGFVAAARSVPGLMRGRSTPSAEGAGVR